MGSTSTMRNYGRLLVLFICMCGVSGLMSPLAASARRQVQVNGKIDGSDAASRRGALQQAAGVAALMTQIPLPASATDLKKFNKKLNTLGLPEVENKFPDGFNALLETYTQSSPKLFVEFLYPNTWLVVKPSINTNGESGTVSAGDYGKGDSAALYVGSASGESIKDKSFLTKTIIAGISQRGDNQYQNFELAKVTSGPENNYVMADFTYELLTGAGFVVERRGVASLTTIGPIAPTLIAVTTSARWKKLGPSLKTVADSFRAYERASNQNLDIPDTLND